MRSSLTMVGIIIGVGSVVLLLAIGTGVKLDVTKQIDSLGSNVVFVVPGKLDATGQPNAMSTLGISTLTEKDCDTLRGTVGIKQVIPLMFVFGAVEHKKETFSAFVFASTPGIFDVRPYPLEEGRLFNASELNKPVCVLSHAPKEQIFGTKSALGQKVQVQGNDFTIVGV
ncbi:MAG: ABC transporter permease, partial [Chthonomonadales bacterium]